MTLELQGFHSRRSQWRFYVLFFLPITYLLAFGSFTPLCLRSIVEYCSNVCKHLYNTLPPPLHGITHLQGQKLISEDRSGHWQFTAQGGIDWMGTRKWKWFVCGRRQAKYVLQGPATRCQDFLSWHLSAWVQVYESKYIMRFWKSVISFPEYSSTKFCKFSRSVYPQDCSILLPMIILISMMIHRILFSMRMFSKSVPYYSIKMCFCKV